MYGRCTQLNYNELLSKLESQRKVIQKRILISVGIVLGFVVVGALLSSDNGFLFGGIIGFIISFGIIADAVSKYKKTFKGQLMPLIIAKTGMDLTYEFKSGLSKDTVMSSKLFKRPDRYRCEDLMYGEFEGVQFRSSDVTMQERRVRTDSKGHRHVEYVTYFLGRWFVYEFNKEFNGIIQVREDGFFSGPSWGLNIDKISLEDVEFNKKFKTYASNQHDAFYVLTPSLMENIKTLERRFPGRIYFSFIGNELHIGIYNSKNAFEPPIFSPLDDQFITSQVQDILILQDIVKELRLNRNIFKD